MATRQTAGIQNTRKASSSASAPKSLSTRKTTAKRSSSATRSKTASSKTASSKTASGRTGAHSTKSRALSHTTSDHDEIREWAEKRGAHPACVKGTGGRGDIGMLRLDFPGYSEEKLQPIDWDQFFEKFDERDLALVYQEKTAGGAKSNFNKLVSRAAPDEKPKRRAVR